MDYTRLGRRIFTAASLAAFTRLAWGDTWNAGLADSRTETYAFTVNQEGSIFGQWCDIKTVKCFWLVGIATSCEDRESYPVLINATKQAAPVTIQCFGKVKVEGRTLWRYVFTEFDDIDQIVRGNRMIGVAIPLDGGRFIVERFDAQGSVDALAKSHKRVLNMAPASTKRESL